MGRLVPSSLKLRVCDLEEDETTSPLRLNYPKNKTEQSTRNLEVLDKFNLTSASGFGIIPFYGRSFLLSITRTLFIRKTNPISLIQTQNYKVKLREIFRSQLLSLRQGEISKPPFSIVEEIFVNPIDPKAAHETLGNILVNVASDLGHIYLGRTIVTIAKVTLDASTVANIALEHGHTPEYQSISLWTPVNDVYFHINGQPFTDDLREYKKGLRYVFTLRIDRIDYDYEDGSYTINSTLIGG